MGPEIGYSSYSTPPIDSSASKEEYKRVKRLETRCSNSCPLRSKHYIDYGNARAYSPTSALCS